MKQRLVIVNEAIDTGYNQCNKKAYGKTEAIAVANAALHSGRVKMMKVYPCPKGHWHVAHINDNDGWVD